MPKDFTQDDMIAVPTAQDDKQTERMSSGVLDVPKDEKKSAVLAKTQAALEVKRVGKFRGLSLIALSLAACGGSVIEMAGVGNLDNSFNQDAGILTAQAHLLA
jgi:hypothetical protein